MEESMTVCVAVIAHSKDVVLGMSDRMLTAGDVQFQASTSKIWPVTNSIVMMAAGDIGTQNEIHTELTMAEP
jgi:20S proteasome alpha/beta subunit